MKCQDLPTIGLAHPHDGEGCFVHRHCPARLRNYGSSDSHCFNGDRWGGHRDAERTVWRESGEPASRVMSGFLGARVPFWRERL